MAKTIGSFDLASLKNLRDDVTQYFWFESDSSSAWGSGAHVTLYPESQFTNSTSPNYMKGQNIIMNTDGFSIRNGGLPMMTLDNDSLDFNAVDTSLGTYTTMATFGLTGATIGQTSGAHSIIDADGQRVYASDGTTQLANIGYGAGASESGTAIAPYYNFGIRKNDTTKGNYSVAEGYDTTASGYCSHTEGYDTTASATCSHTEGYKTTASKSYSHAEGLYTTASGIYASHAEGNYATASGESSHAEGSYTTASGNYSHAEGGHTTASGYYSHAEGGFTTTGGAYSHAQNYKTIAAKNAQTALGTYNEEDTATTTTHPNGIASYGQYAVIIGNGTADNARSNALTVDWNGNITINGHSSSIGTTETHIPSAISCATGKYYQVAYLTLDPGTWIISGSARFQQSNTTGIRRVLFTNDTSNYDNVTTQPSSLGNIWYQTFNGSAFPTSGGADVKTTSAPVNVTTEKPTIRLIAYQSSGSAMNVTGRFYAIRIK